MKPKYDYLVLDITKELDCKFSTDVSVSVHRNHFSDNHFNINNNNVSIINQYYK